MFPLLDHIPILDGGSHTALYEYPGEYHNCFNDPVDPIYNTPTHTWSHPAPVDLGLDPPYSSYAVAGHDSHPQLNFIGGVGVGGGQGNSDCIFGDCDDHDTYGVLGSGWQGPGNGEDIGTLWNPAVSTSTGMHPTMALAAPLPSPALEGGRDEAKEGVREGEGPKPSRASLSHVMLMGHACLYGAITALVDEGVQKGEVSWRERFETNATRAAEAVTPVGGALLKARVFA